MKNRRAYIVEIGNCLVSSEIITEYFACDYEACHGACCIIGDSGAPLEEGEETFFEQEYKGYEELLTPEGKEALREQGFAITDRDGDLVTPLVNGEECAYTCFDKEGNCFCAVEKAWFAGGCRFRKPISCQLYPIRVSILSNGMYALNLHRWHICSDAFAKGSKEKIPVYKFLREPLIRKFGEEFYSSLEEAANSFLAAE